MPKYKNKIKDKKMPFNALFTSTKSPSLDFNLRKCMKHKLSLFYSSI